MTDTALFGYIGLFSLLLSLLSLLLIPHIVSRLPEDYFCHQYRQRLPPRNPRRGLITGILKNVLGCCLLLAGVAMLVLPGQGLLTLLAGLLLVDFPGKYTLECWLVEKPGVMRSINWIRQRAKRQPLRKRQPADKPTRTTEHRH